jgi:hypothetical protein
MKKIHHILVLHGPIWMLHVWVKGLRMDEWVDGWIVMASWSLIAHMDVACLSERLENGWMGGWMNSNGKLVPHGPHMDVTCWVRGLRMDEWVDGWILMASWSLIAHMDVACWVKGLRMDEWVDGWIVMASWSLIAHMDVTCWVRGLRMDEWVDGWIVMASWSLISHMDVTCWVRGLRMDEWVDGWIVMASWSLMAPYGCYMLSEKLEDGWIVVTRDSERALFRRMIFLSFFLCQLGTYQSSNPWKWRQRERHLTKSKHSFISWKRGGGGEQCHELGEVKICTKNEQS